MQNKKSKRVVEKLKSYNPHENVNAKYVFEPGIVTFCNLLCYKRPTFSRVGRPMLEMVYEELKELIRFYLHADILKGAIQILWDDDPRWLDENEGNFKAIAQKVLNFFVECWMLSPKGRERFRFPVSSSRSKRS